MSKSRMRLILVSGGALLIAAAALGVGIIFHKHQRTPEEEAPAWADAKRIRSGDTVAADNDNKLVYAGIRAPIEGEPLFEESRARNAELVEGRKLRLRFDAGERDKKDRLVAYAWVDGTFVNRLLVSEGLAYARLSTTTQRFANDLLSAQAEARRARRGLWKLAAPAADTEYWADPKYGTFHRSACEERKKAKPERIAIIKSRSEALDHGLAPCPKCLP